MSEIKHTPGPWAHMPEEVDRPYVRIRGTRLGERYKIANVPTPIYGGVHEREAQETRANARLIAAAPDLLEACQMMLACMGLANWEGDPAAEKARDAIAKAIGDQS